MKEKGNRFFKNIILKRNSISGAMWMTMVFTFIVIVCSFTISYSIMSARAQNDYRKRESETLINGVINNIQSNIDNYKDLSRLIMLNDQVIAYLRADKVDRGLSNDAKAGVWNVLNVCRNVDSVYIFRNDGYYMTTGKGLYDVDIELIQDESWSKPILDERGGVVFCMNANGAIYKNNRSPILSISRAIYDIYSQKQTGLLVVNISELLFERALTGQGSEDICILDKEGNFITGNKKLAACFNQSFLLNDIVYQNIRIDGKSRIVAGYAFDEIPIVILCSSTASVKVFPKENQFIILGLFVSFIVAIVFASYFVSKNLTGPILRLSSEMERTKSRGWIEKIDAQMPDNEIGMLTDSYNSMIDYMNDLFKKLLDKEKSVQKAEMSVLYEQIKPHFLYNSLETISFMALEAGADNVHDALETLGSFYRNFLSKGNKIIPLKREVSIVKDYLALQKLRYKDILEDSYDISEDTMDCILPKLMLQPIVENSIYHGIRLKGEPGEISVKTYLEGNLLHIIVKDTGVGMTQECIDRILSDEKDNDVSKEIGNHSNFGLKGTINRVRYFCDCEDVVKISSEVGEYTEIEFIIPQGGTKREE